MLFTDQLAALRADRRMSLAAIGGIVGMAVSNLSAILRGRGDTKASTLGAIASALDAEWVLVPREHLQEVRRAVNGGAPATAGMLPRTVEMSARKK